MFKKYSDLPQRESTKDILKREKHEKIKKLQNVAFDMNRSSKERFEASRELGRLYGCEVLETIEDVDNYFLGN